MKVLRGKDAELIDAVNDFLKDNSKEFRDMLGMTRQQFKQFQREKDKYQQALNKLTPVQIKAVDMLIESQNKESVELVRVVLNSCVNATLWDVIPDLDMKKQDAFWEQVNQLVTEDLLAREKLMGMSKGEVKMVENKAQEFIREQLKAGVNQSQIREDLKFKFPLMSSAMIKNAICEVRDKLKSEQEEVKGAKEIMNIIEDPKKSKKAKKEVVAPEVTKNKVEEIKVKNVVEYKDVVKPEENTIIKELKAKLSDYDAEKDDIVSQIAELNGKIEEFKMAIIERENHLNKIDVKVNNCKTMLELANNI